MGLLLVRPEGWGGGRPGGRLVFLTGPGRVFVRRSSGGSIGGIEEERPIRSAAEVFSRRADDGGWGDGGGMESARSGA